MMGRIYNKEAVVRALIDKKADKKENKLNHVKGLKVLYFIFFNA